MKKQYSDHLIEMREQDSELAEMLNVEPRSMKEIQSLMEGSTLALNLEGRTFDLTLDGINVIRQEKENLKGFDL